jgi:hypothetical protein
MVLICLKCNYSCFILFKCTNNFGSVLQNLFDHRIYKNKCPHPSAYCLLFLVSRINLTFSSILKIYLSFVTKHVITLLSPVNCRVEKQRETSSTVTATVAFSRPGLYVATCSSRVLALSRTRRYLNSQNSLLLAKLHWN